MGLEKKVLEKRLEGDKAGMSEAERAAYDQAEEQWKLEGPLSGRLSAEGLRRMAVDLCGVVWCSGAKLTFFAAIACGNDLVSLYVSTVFQGRRCLVRVATSAALDCQRAGAPTTQVLICDSTTLTHWIP